MKQEDKKIWRAILMVSQIGISMMTPIFLSAFIGYWLDKWLNTQYWFIIFVLLGVCAAFRSVYVLTKSFYAKDLREEEAKQKYFDDLKNQNKKIPNKGKDSH